MHTPAYLMKPGEFLQKRIEALARRSSPCMLCPRRCRVNRAAGELGFCRTGYEPQISSYGAHHGEEEPISGISGSGTVFLTGCTMRCLFCQNLEISRGGFGHRITAEELAGIFIRLQALGCHNINLVTPTHQLPAIVRALSLAVDQGLCIPLVYNTGGYDDPETLNLLEGIIDIYMPDFKFSDAKTGEILAGTPEYPFRAMAAITEMHRQVGDLVIENGIAVRGVLIRHLILPGFTAGSGEILRFIAEGISKKTWVNLMDQYYPAGEVRKTCPAEYPSLLRRVSREEVREVSHIASAYGLSRGFQRSDKNRVE
jgi:putative pyruvate formate lyase activating enzyme